MDYPERVETPRLTLRRPTQKDAPAFRNVWSDPAVWASLRPGEAHHPERAATDSHSRQLRHWEEHGFGLWAVVPHGETEPVGWAGAWLPDFVPDLAGEVEVGWTLRGEWWGRGLASEAARASAARAFEHVAPPRVISLIAAGNDRSESVALRLGMRRDGEATTDRDVLLQVFELPAPDRPTAPAS